MTGLTNIYLKIKDISKECNVHITQLSNLRFHVELYGDMMETYFQLGNIQKELEIVCKNNGYLLTTVLGDKQDAFFQIKVNKKML